MPFERRPIRVANLLWMMVPLGMIAATVQYAVRDPSNEPLTVAMVFAICLGTPMARGAYVRGWPGMVLGGLVGLVVAAGFALIFGVVDLCIFVFGA